MEDCLADPRLQAVATLRRAIGETFALGYHDVARGIEALLAAVDADPGTAARIDVAAGQVTIGGRPVTLSNRELELCLALGVHHNPLPSETLADLIFPDLDIEAALNRIKVYVHRVREKIAPDFISCSRFGYALRAGVTTDLREYGDLLALLRPQPFLTDENRKALRRIVASTYATRNAPAWRWQWFAPVEQRIANVASQAAARLAADAFERKATAELLDLAQIIARHDPCDEQGREIAIKAYLAAGKPHEALAEFKRYSAALQRDLGGTPSAQLRELLETA